MNKFIKTILVGAVAVGFTSCEDFLDRQPESSLIPETYFTDAALLEAYTQNFYEILPAHGVNYYTLGTFASDNGTDNQIGLDPDATYAPGVWLTPQRSGYWDFSGIRQVNFFFENVLPLYESNGITGEPALIEQSIGEAYFFRAWMYWERYKELGDFPIIENVLPDEKEPLLEASVRQPRNKVARFILADLDKAIAHLPVDSRKGKNGLNKACAQLFRARVALFEGTWLKYHKGTALVPGGPGWPGDASLLGSFDIDSEISYFLGEAISSSKPVADAVVNDLVENTDAPEGQNVAYESLNPYYTMFCDQDLNRYSEVLMFKSYLLSEQVRTQIQAQFQKNGGGSGWTRGMVNSFLMRNGLPIYAANSGYDPAWENQGVTATLQGRDSRIQIFTKGDNSIDTYSLVDGSPVYYRMGWLMDGDGSTKATTGYAIKKGKGYDYREAQANNLSVTGSITFRATEAMLIYMEAKFEKDGALDGTADSYWKALRRRAKVDDNYSKTIAATIMTEEAKWDWGAYSAGSLVSPTLYNIRRERRHELMAEAQRMDDLRRWSALDQLISQPYQIEGIKYWGTVYNDPNSPLCMKRDNGSYLAPIVNETDGTGTMSAQAYSNYVRPYQITRQQNPVFDGLTFTRAHYLSPIGHDNFTRASTDGKVETSVIYQNPGWSTETGAAPTSF